MKQLKKACTMWKTTITDCWRDGLSRDEQKRLLLSFGAVFLFGLAAHAYGFLRAGFSHDMLNALVVEPVETYWKMQLGRPSLAEPVLLSDGKTVPNPEPLVCCPDGGNPDSESFRSCDDRYLSV